MFALARQEGVEREKKKILCVGSPSTMAASLVPRSSRTATRTSIVWDDVYEAARAGRLFPHLVANVPRSLWGERNLSGKTLLHSACREGDVVAVAALLKHGLDVNAVGSASWTPAHVAAANGHSRALELLCAAGADLRAQTSRGSTPLDFCLLSASSAIRGSHGCICVLVANGVRLQTARDQFLITPEVAAFERGVLRCRDMVVVLLGIKRRRTRNLLHVDKFLFREIAHGFWATRTDPAWQPAAQGAKRPNKGSNK